MFFLYWVHQNLTRVWIHAISVQEPKPNIYQDKEEIGDTTDNTIDVSSCDFLYDDFTTNLISKTIFCFFVTPQTFMDDCTIPSPALKDNGMSSFFGPDLSTALQLLGM